LYLLLFLAHIPHFHFRVDIDLLTYPPSLPPSLPHSLPPSVRPVHAPIPSSQPECSKYDFSSFEEFDKDGDNSITFAEWQQYIQDAEAAACTCVGGRWEGGREGGKGGRERKKV